VLAIYTGRGGATAGFIDAASADTGLVGIVLSETSFYYESGGQVFDTGALQLLGGKCFPLCVQFVFTRLHLRPRKLPPASQK
jgi:alanyl-tRNA synthetase